MFYRHSYKYILRQVALRFAAMLICAFFITAFMLSTVFISLHANHKHDHNRVDGSCATCGNITAAENLLKTVYIAVVTVAFAPCLLSGITRIINAAGAFVAARTLIRLKVRLNR